MGRNWGLRVACAYFFPLLHEYVAAPRSAPILDTVYITARSRLELGAVGRRRHFQEVGSYMLMSQRGSHTYA